MRRVPCAIWHDLARPGPLLATVQPVAVDGRHQVPDKHVPASGGLAGASAMAHLWPAE